MPFVKVSKYDKGQSLPELAVGLVVIVLLLSGVVDFGRAFFSYMALRDAVQEGALYGSLNPANTPGIESRVKGIADSPLDVTRVTVTTTVPGSPCAGHQIQVQATYDFPLLIPFLGGFLGSQTIPIRASVIDYIVRPPC